MSCDDGHAVGPQTVNYERPLSRRPPVVFFFSTFFFLRYATFLSCRLLLLVPLVSHRVAFFSTSTLFSPTYTVGPRLRPGLRVHAHVSPSLLPSPIPKGDSIHSSTWTLDANAVPLPSKHPPRRPWRCIYAIVAGVSCRPAPPLARLPYFPGLRCRRMKT